MQNIHIELSPLKKIYFASDFHLGAPDEASSFEREKKLVRWLDFIKKDAQTVILLGDIFDFWFEYKYVVPKGYVRLLGKLAELSDAGIQLVFFTGNHDMWMFGYLSTQFNVSIYRKETTLVCNGKRIYLHHGDGLGKFDYKYKILKFFFNSKLCQALFAFVHPFIGFGIATNWSKSSRKANHENDEKFLGEKEWLWSYLKDFHIHNPHDYYILGHRHLFMKLPIGGHAQYINLGEWVKNSNYAYFDGTDMHTLVFE